MAEKEQSTDGLTEVAVYPYPDNAGGLGVYRAENGETAYVHAEVPDAHRGDTAPIFVRNPNKNKS